MGAYKRKPAYLRMIKTSVGDVFNKMHAMYVCSKQVCYHYVINCCCITPKQQSFYFAQCVLCKKCYFGKIKQTFTY